MGSAHRSHAEAERGERSRRHGAPDRSPAPTQARDTAFDRLSNRTVLSLLRSGALQRKARIAPTSDPREREADRAADAVVSGRKTSRMPATSAGRGDGAEIQRAPTEFDQLSQSLGLGPVSVSAASPSGQPGRPTRAGHAIGGLGGGRAMEEDTRRLMEHRFGADFTGVRIYTDHHAHEAADRIQARAFTVGEDVVFGEGEYAPETTEGKRLLAHELAHVVQQRRPEGAVAGDNEAERDAHDAAHAVAGGGSPSVRERAAPGSVQRQPEEWGFSRPTSQVLGTTVEVNSHPMAYIPRGELVRKEGSSWDPSSRTYGVSVSQLGSRAWQKYSSAEADAHRDNLVVVLTSKSGWDNTTRTITIGGRQPAKPPTQPSGPPTDPRHDHDPDHEHEHEHQHEPRARETTKTKASPGARSQRVERQSQSDPEGALKAAGDLSKRELTSLGSEPRKALLNAAAGASRASSAPRLAHDLVTTTPDQDAGAVADMLQADGGKLLDDLKRNEPDRDARSALDEAARDLEARRRDAPPPQSGRDYVEWTPELQKKANEVREALKKIGRRPPGLTEDMEGRPEWSAMKSRQDALLQMELRNLDRVVSRWDAEHGAAGKVGADSVAGIGATAREEVTKALDRVRAARTITELFEARRLATTALWRANQYMDAKRALEHFQSAVRMWNEKQGGLASLASVPSHALAGVSADRPDQIAAEAQSAVNREFDLLREAKTPEEMSRAATMLKQTIADAHFALSAHQDEVYEGGEKTIVGIEGVAVVSAAVVAPEYVIPGFFIGGGLGAARQGVQLAEGSRTSFSGREVFDSGVAGGILAPLAVGAPVVAYGLSGLGVVSAANEFSEGHGWTGAFDLATAALPFAAKRAPEFGRWARPRVAAITLRVGIGATDAGLGGRSLPMYSLPNEPSISMVVDARGRPVGVRSAPVETAPALGAGQAAPAPPPRSPGVWQSVTVGNRPYQPYQIPVVVRVGVADPVDAALAPNAPYQGGGLSQVNRVRTTSSGRTLLSLDSIALTPAQRQAARAIHGQSLRGNLQQIWQNATNPREQTDLVEIRRLWNQGTAQSQQDARVLARDAFNRHRDRYWAAVRADPAARGAFQAAGMSFTGGRTSAPIYNLPDGTVARMTLEHTVRLADDPTNSLNGANLQFVLDDENSVFLEFIRANDPHQR